jgi:hypothetical protein
MLTLLSAQRQDAENAKGTKEAKEAKRAKEARLTGPRVPASMGI